MFVVRKKGRAITTVIKVFLEMHEIMSRLCTMKVLSNVCWETAMWKSMLKAKELCWGGKDWRAEWVDVVMLKKMCWRAESYTERERIKGWEGLGRDGAVLCLGRDYFYSKSYIVGRYFYKEIIHSLRLFCFTLMYTCMLVCLPRFLSNAWIKWLEIKCSKLCFPIMCVVKYISTRISRLIFHIKLLLFIVISTCMN